MRNRLEEFFQFLTYLGKDLTVLYSYTCNFLEREWSDVSQL